MRVCNLAKRSLQPKAENPHQLSSGFVILFIQFQKFYFRKPISHLSTLSLPHNQGQNYICNVEHRSPSQLLQDFDEYMLSFVV